MSAELDRWSTFVGLVLRRMTKKELYDKVRAEVGVRADVAAAAKSRGHTLSAANSEQLWRAVEAAGTGSERVRAYFYAAYPRNVAAAPEENPPRLRQAHVAGNGASSAPPPPPPPQTAPPEEKRAGERAETEEEESEREEERSRQRQQEMDATRRQGELAIWSVWLAPGARVRAKFAFYIGYPLKNAAWQHVEKLPSYSADDYHGASFEMTAVVVSCRGNRCVLELPAGSFTQLQEAERRITFYATVSARCIKWEPSTEDPHNALVFGRPLHVWLCCIYAPEQMLADLKRRYLVPAVLHTTLLIYRPWKYGVLYENALLSGTWTEGEIREQHASHLVVRVDRQDVRFDLPNSFLRYDHIPLIEAKTMFTESLPAKGRRRRVRKVQAGYELSLVPRLTEQRNAIATSDLSRRLPDILQRLIGDFVG